MNTEHKVKDVIALLIGIKPEEVEDDQTLTDIGLDSLDFIECLMTLERDLEIELDDSDEESGMTVARLVALVDAGLEGRE